MKKITYLALAFGLMMSVSFASCDKDDEPEKKEEQKIEQTQDDKDKTPEQKDPADDPSKTPTDDPSKTPEDDPKDPIDPIDPPATEETTKDVEANLGQYNAAWLLDGSASWTLSCNSQYKEVKLGSTVKKADYKTLKIEFAELPTDCQLIVASPEGKSQWGGPNAIGYPQFGSTSFELDLSSVENKVDTDWDADSKSYKTKADVVNLMFSIQSKEANAACKVNKVILVDNNDNETVLNLAPSAEWTTAEENPKNTVLLSARYANCFIFNDFKNYKTYEVEIDGEVPAGLKVSCDYKVNGDTKYDGVEFVDGKATYDMSNIPAEATDFSVYIQNNSDGALTFKVKSAKVSK